MFATDIYYPLVRALRDRPDEPAVVVGDKSCDNRRFAMLVAPVMNELDTYEDEVVALRMEDEPLTYAALIACLLCGKTIVPLQKSWTEQQCVEVMQNAGAKHCLDKDSMYYFYWMTYEDALCRIDSGLLPYRDIPVAAFVYDFDENEELVRRVFSADDLFLYLCAPVFKNIKK